MHFINDWLDIARVLVSALSVWCVFTLIQRFRKNSKKWTTKTKDYWFSMLMWSLAGVELPLQGVLLNRPLTPALVVVTAAVLVTGKGLHQKGAWGGEDS